jgi:hypothetical protein
MGPMKRDGALPQTAAMHQEQQFDSHRPWCVVLADMPQGQHGDLLLPRGAHVHNLDEDGHRPPQRQYRRGDETGSLAAAVGWMTRQVRGRLPLAKEGRRY